MIATQGYAQGCLCKLLSKASPGVQLRRHACSPLYQNVGSGVVYAADADTKDRRCLFLSPTLSRAYSPEHYSRQRITLSRAYSPEHCSLQNLQLVYQLISSRQVQRQKFYIYMPHYRSRSAHLLYKCGLRRLDLSNFFSKGMCQTSRMASADVDGAAKRCNMYSWHAQYTPH
jgi:hypothetical protein